MITQEIRDTDWAAFCSKFERLHQGDLMTLFHQHRTGYQDEIVRDMPFRKMWFDASDKCNNRIFITFQMEGKREVTHEIVEPIHIKVREEGEGSKGLQIDGEDGSTFLKFSSGKLDQLLGH